MSNPHVLSWTNPTTNTDGSPYTQANNAGYEISFDGTPQVSIPLAWGTSFDMASTGGYEALKSGSHTVTLAVINTAGVASAPSAAATFSIAAVPNPPTGLVVT